MNMRKFDLGSEIIRLEGIIKNIENIKTLLFKRSKNTAIGDIDRVISNLKYYHNIINTRTGEVSDGYHSFSELYYHRAILFMTICNEHPELAWKSLFHDEPNQPMYTGMFICGIETPMGQATYHYNIDPFWNMFKVKELPRAPKWDGHNSEQAIERIASLTLHDINDDNTDDLLNDLNIDDDYLHGLEIG